MPYSNTVRYGLGFQATEHAVHCRFVRNSIGGAFTSEDTDAASAATADITNPSAVADLQYFGNDAPFVSLRYVFSTAPVGGVVAWEYWNGSAWVALSGLTAVLGNVNLTSATNHLAWATPTDWATTTINAQSAFWVRRRITTVYSTAGIGSYVSTAVWKEVLNRTIHLPEATNRTIDGNLSFVRLSYHDATGNGPAGAYVRWRVNGGTWRERSQVQSVVATEHNTHTVLVSLGTSFPTDVGSATSFTLEIATAHLVRIPNTSAFGFENECGELFLTATADEQATRLKTVVIPLESPVGALGTALGNIGSSQVPALTGGSGFLPEAGVVIRDCYFVMEGGSGGDGTTDYQYGFRLGTEAETLSDVYEQSLASTPYVRLVWVKTPADTTQAYQFAMRTTVAGCGLNHVAVRMVVTYEYNDAASTRVLNSVQLAGQWPQYSLVTAAPGHEIAIPWQVQEANVTLQQSAVCVYVAGVSGGGNTLLSVGAQAFRTYTRDDGAAPGGTCLQQRFDTGSAQGAGHTLARGQNLLQLRAYRGTAIWAPLSAVVYLNYHSDRHAAGSQVHARTVLAHPILQGAGNNDTLAGWAVVLPTTYTLNALFYDGVVQSDGAHGSEVGFAMLAGEVAPTGSARNVSSLTAAEYSSAGGNGYNSSPCALDLRGVFRAWSGDVAPFLDPVVARTLQRRSSYTHTVTLAGWATYHQITYTTARTLTGEAGAGDGLTVSVFDVASKQHLASAVTAAGGDWSYVDHDNTAERFAVCRESSTHVGASDHFTPGT